MILIPAIDIINGQCVRLTQGDYAKKQIYDGSPVEIAQRYEDAGITHLHLVDLDGAKAGHIVNAEIIEQISTTTRLHIDFGGGVRTDEDLRIAFDAGAEQITAGSLAVRSPEVVKRWLHEYGSDKIIIGADVKQNKIAIQGWTAVENLHVFDFLSGYQDSGLQYVISTDIEHDGAMRGPSMSLYQRLMDKFPDIKFYASGGISSIEDLHMLKDQNIYAAIIGKALLEGHISLDEIAKLC